MDTNTRMDKLTDRMIKAFETKDAAAQIAVIQDMREEFKAQLDELHPAPQPIERKQYIKPPLTVLIFKAWIVWACIVTVFSGVVIYLAQVTP